MRRLAFIAVIFLTGCSTQGYSPINATPSAPPLDPDYRSLVRAFVAPNDQGLSISRPRLIRNWGVNDPPIWVLCAKFSSGDEELLTLEESHVSKADFRKEASSHQAEPHPEFCDDEQYSQL